MMTHTHNIVKTQWTKRIMHLFENVSRQDVKRFSIVRIKKKNRLQGVYLSLSLEIKLRWFIRLRTHIRSVTLYNTLIVDCNCHRAWSSDKKHTLSYPSSIMWRTIDYFKTNNRKYLPSRKRVFCFFCSFCETNTSKGMRLFVFKITKWQKRWIIILNIRIKTSCHTFLQSMSSL